MLQLGKKEKNILHKIKHFIINKRRKSWDSALSNSGPQFAIEIALAGWVGEGGGQEMFSA